MKIELLNMDDAHALFKFECENRGYFNQYVPSREEEYYQFDYFLKRHAELLDEIKQGTSYFYLIKNAGEILGRINVVDVDAAGCASLGYRVGETSAGKGVASHALQLLLEEVRNYPIHKIKAKTTVKHVGSRRVLEKNGFRLMKDGILDEEFVHYEFVIDTN